MWLRLKFLMIGIMWIENISGGAGHSHDVNFQHYLIVRKYFGRTADGIHGGSRSMQDHLSTNQLLHLQRETSIHQESVPL